ncbi:MFS transporter, partial [Xanthomonas oryzae pv. oryzae]
MRSAGRGLARELGGQRVIAIDWGTSSLRGYLLDADGKVL